MSAPDHEGKTAQTPDQQSRAAPPAARARPRVVYWLAAGCVVCVGVGAWALTRPPARTEDPKAVATVGKGDTPGPKPDAAPRNQVLFARGKMDGWVGQTGSSYQIVKYSDGEQSDPEKVGVLRGEGEAVRAFEPPLPTAFRVTLALDVSEAQWVELVVAESRVGGYRQLLIRIDNRDRDKPKVFDYKHGAGEPFVRLEFRDWRRLRTAVERRKQNQSPYALIRYTREGDRISVALDGGVSNGSHTLDGLETTRLRVEAIGGPVFIAAADLEDLSVGQK